MSDIYYVMVYLQVWQISQFRLFFVYSTQYLVWLVWQRYIFELMRQKIEKYRKNCNIIQYDMTLRVYVFFILSCNQSGKIKKLSTLVNEKREACFRRLTLLHITTNETS